MAKFELDSSFLTKYTDIFNYLKNLNIPEDFHGKWILSHSARGRAPLILLKRPEYCSVRHIANVTSISGINTDERKLMAVSFQPGSNPDKTLLVRKHRQWASVANIGAWRNRMGASRVEPAYAWLSLSERFDRKTHTYSSKTSLESAVEKVLTELLAEML